MSDEFDPTDKRNALRDEKLLLDLLSWVPGWVVMEQSAVDRILLEQEALRIERDEAREALQGREAPHDLDCSDPCSDPACPVCGDLENLMTEDEAEAEGL